MYGEWIALALKNFGFTMFVLAIIFMIINALVTRGRVPESEIVYRWLALFCLGFLGIYAFIIHAFFPHLASGTIGWATSPFQYEVAIADLGFGVVGLLSFNASYGFRLAAVIGATIWLWGDATGHIYQMIQYRNFSTGNAGSWFWMDVFLPLLLITCIAKMKDAR